jgi:hypothetical protein
MMKISKYVLLVGTDYLTINEQAVLVPIKGTHKFLTEMAPKGQLARKLMRTSGRAKKWMKPECFGIRRKLMRQVNDRG